MRRPPLHYALKTPNFFKMHVEHYKNLYDVFGALARADETAPGSLRVHAKRVAGLADLPWYSTLVAPFKKDTYLLKIHKYDNTYEARIAHAYLAAVDADTFLKGVNELLEKRASELADKEKRTAYGNRLSTLRDVVSKHDAALLEALSTAAPALSKAITDNKFPPALHKAAVEFTKASGTVAELEEKTRNADPVDRCHAKLSTAKGEKDKAMLSFLEKFSKHGGLNGTRLPPLIRPPAKAVESTGREEDAFVKAFSSESQPPHELPAHVVVSEALAVRERLLQTKTRLDKLEKNLLEKALRMQLSWQGRLPDKDHAILSRH
jgi:hypothetical protein